MAQKQVSLSDSVGEGGANKRADVRKVQQYLNRAGVTPKLEEDGYIGPMTLAAIRQFQAGFMKKPDGRVDVGGKSWSRLIQASQPQQETSSPVSQQWSGDSARWSQQKKLDSLHPEFRLKVENMLAALKEQGFKPKVFYGWRSQKVQARLLKEGKSRVSFSFHNAQLPTGRPNSYAVDIIDSRWGWNEEAEQNGFWDAMGRVAKQQGLYWGGNWKSFKDVAHVQYVANSRLKEIKKESGLA